MILALYGIILLFIFNLLLLILAYRHYQSVKLIHQDISEFRNELIQLVSQRKRRF